MIVTLAGHVDHGKTTLVRLLTGKDTDRLPDEKRRGLTIDLGFAYLEEGETTLGFVDVPGHHRFIHNMVAGIAAMQYGLLVVAADDGPMPQSREHLQILELLGITDGVIALSKCDRASASRIAAARDEIRKLVAGTFLEAAPIIETAANTQTGLDLLRAHLLRAAAQHGQQQERRAFRLAVDRAFTLKGIGLVVTGTVHSGQVAVNDELHVFPLGGHGRVRDLRVQDQPAARAGCGDRTAINLTGHGTGTLQRGHWLCAGPQSGHRSLVLDLQVLDDFPREVRHWSSVHVYHATSHATARLALLQGPRLSPGQHARAELILDEPLLGKRGDRIIVRDQALERTLGGGAVIDNLAAPGRRRAPPRLRAIEARAAPTPGAALRALLDEGPVDLQAFESLWNLPPDDLHELLGGLDALVHGGSLVARSIWQQWRTALLDECRRRHDGDPTLQGLRENEFAAPVPEEFRATLLGELAAAAHLLRRAGRYFPHRHQVALSATERNLLERLHPHLDQTQPPSLGDLGRLLHLPLAELKDTVGALVSKGALVQVSTNRLYLPQRLLALAQTAEMLSRQGPFSVREFRDAASIGRNVVIDVLEYFDGRGFTRRQGETRTVVGERSRLASALG